MLTTLSQLKEAALQIKKDLLTLCAQKSIHIGGDQIGRASCRERV